MLHRIKTFLNNNFLLKVVSIAVAAIIWLMVENISDPVVYKTYTNVPVTITNGAYIESSGKTYRLDNEQQTVTVTLRGNSSKVSQRMDDITAVADLTQIVNMESDPIMVPVSVTCSGIPQENITVSPVTIQLEIEDKVSADFMISINTGDTTPGKGKEVGDITANPEKVTISGPETIVNKIDSVVASVSVEGLTKSTRKKADLVIYDKNQEILSEAESKYLTFDIGDPQITVHIELWSTLSGVTFDVQTSGEPAEGYMLSGISTTPGEVTVAGSKSALETLQENGNVITIPGENVDISGLESDSDIRVNVKDLLPEGIELSSNTSDTIMVTVNIIPEGSQRFTIETKDIEKQNLAEDLNLVFDKRSVVVVIKGDPDVLADMQSEDIEASIDLENYSEGTYNIPLTIQLPDNLTVVEQPQVRVTISRTIETTGNS